MKDVFSSANKHGWHIKDPNQLYISEQYPHTCVSCGCGSIYAFWFLANIYNLVHCPFAILCAFNVRGKNWWFFLLFLFCFVFFPWQQISSLLGYISLLPSTYAQLHLCTVLFTYFLILLWLLQLRQKISSATSAIKSVFGQEEKRQEDAVSFISLVTITISF